MNRHFAHSKLAAARWRNGWLAVIRLGFLCAYALSDDICPEDYLENQGTIEAYQNILNGNADLIFVAQPSTAQKQLAEASGVKLVYTPLHVKRLCLSSTKTIPCHR